MWRKGPDASTAGYIAHRPPLEPPPYSGSMTSSTPSSRPEAPARSHRTSSLVLVGIAAALVAGLFGLVIGGLGGTLLAGGIGIGSDSRMDQNISEGCAILDRLEEDLPVQEDSLGLEDPLVFELGAAGHHFLAAGAGDNSGVLWSGGSDLVAGMSRLDVELTNQGIETLEETCANA